MNFQYRRQTLGRWSQFRRATQSYKLSKVTDNLAGILEQIRRSEAQYTRPAGSVHLVAVSKRKPLSAILAARQAGQLDFAENYVQEGVAKVTEAADPSIVWHFIGHIQSNKTREIATHFDWVHSVDREKIARRLSEHRSASEAPLNVCLQVNLQNEPGKSGLAPDQVLAVAQRVDELAGLRLRGLMAIPAPSENFDEQRAVFEQLTKLRDTLNKNGLAVDVLSMGMSGDLEAAIAAGATHIRIGTALFGPR